MTIPSYIRELRQLETQISHQMGRAEGLKRHDDADRLFRALQTVQAVRQDAEQESPPWTE